MKLINYAGCSLKIFLDQLLHKFCVLIQHVHKFSQKMIMKNREKKIPNTSPTPPSLVGDSTRTRASLHVISEVCYGFL